MDNSSTESITKTERLVWFALLLLGGYPTLIATRAVVHYFEVVDLFPEHESTLQIFILSVILDACALIYSIFIGTEIWILAKDSIQKAKMFVIIITIYILVVGYLPFFGYMQSSSIQALINIYFKIIVIIAVSSCISLLRYLKYSPEVMRVFKIDKQT